MNTINLINSLIPIFLILGLVLLSDGLLKYFVTMRHSSKTIPTKWFVISGTMFCFLAGSLWWYRGYIQISNGLNSDNNSLQAPQVFPLPHHKTPPQITTSTAPTTTPSLGSVAATDTPPVTKKSFRIIEDAGKENVEYLPEVEALRQKYGEQRLFIKALDRHLIGHEAEWHTDHATMMEHDELLYSVRPDWDPKITGCVIIVYAAGEGYVYQEDKALKVIGTETLAQFFKKTEKVSPEIMYRFYLSLH